MLTKQQVKDFDFGQQMNEKMYGDSEPPVVDFSKVKLAGVPIAMYNGRDDKIVSQEDSRWARDTLGEVVVDFEEIQGGHLSFFVSRNQTYFQVNALNIIKKYNPL